MISKATLEDKESIIKLGKTFIDNFSNTYNIEEYLNNNNYIILINKENKLLKGFLIIYKNIDYYELELIIVDKEYRKQGIATSLLEHFFNTFCTSNDIVFLEVSCENETAINLYTKFNFITINKRKKYYGNIDAYVMKKVIE